MDRQAANTLRTLGIVLISIFLIVGSAVLLLASACFGLVASSSHESQAGAFAIGTLIAAIVLISIGTAVIARLSRGIVHAAPPPPLSYSPAGMVPAATVPTAPVPAAQASTGTPSFSLD